jgi:5,10-methylenetetrahydrofolate reductase
MNTSALEALKEKSGRPLLCLEVNPPRGVDVEAVLSRFASLQGVDLVNITDSALAKMRCSALSFAALFKQRVGIEPLVNLSCRDRNVIGMQSELLGAWTMGVRSIVALTGDAVTVGDLPDAKGVFEVNSIGLLKIIAALNGGKDLSGLIQT